MKIKSYFSHDTLRKSLVGRAVSLLNRKDRKKVLIISSIQILMGSLDLMGVILIGALGALSVQGLESKTSGNKVEFLLKFLNLQSQTFQVQIACLGVFAAFLLILKTVLSIILTRKTFFFLSRKGAQISAEMISRLLSQSLLRIQSRSSQQTLLNVTVGVQDLMIGILATSIQIASDLSLLFIMFVGLVVLDPVMAISTVLMFVLVGYLLNQLLQVRARTLGENSYKYALLSNEKILEVLNSYRESIVRNRREFYSNEIGKIRYKLADTSAEAAFMPYISKYVIDSTTVLGAVLLSAYEFTTNNAVYALSIMAVFLASSSRIAPAALRIQQGILNIKRSGGAAEESFLLAEELKELPLQTPGNEVHSFSYNNFYPELTVENVSFRYPGAEKFALQNVNFQIGAGSSVAIVGPSGAGKTTLVDLILGVLYPDSGGILISGKTPQEATKCWPGAISYVPQDVFIANGTIRQNVALGFPDSVATDERVNRAISIAQLLELSKSLRGQLDTEVGENGSKLSGGQRQRLGIARSLFTEPKLLVLDEATSSLDGQTEADISGALSKLRGKVTLIVVAHRLATIRTVDKILYVDKGKILSIGTFEEVRKSIPDFDRQAGLMGL